MRVPALLEQWALGVVGGVMAADLAFDLPVVLDAASPAAVARAVAYYKVTLASPLVTVLVASAVVVLAVVRVVSHRWSADIGQLITTAVFVPVAAVFFFLAYPAEQYIAASADPTALTAFDTAKLVTSLLVLGWAHIAMAGALAIAGALTVAFPARRRLLPLPPTMHEKQEKQE